MIFTVYTSELHIYIYIYFSEFYIYIHIYQSGTMITALDLPDTEHFFLVNLDIHSMYNSSYKTFPNDLFQIQLNTGIRPFEFLSLDIFGRCFKHLPEM